MSSNYKEMYEEARQQAISLLGVEDESISLNDLMQILFNNFNETGLLNSLIVVAYKNGVAFEKLDDFLQAASLKLAELEKEETIDSQEMDKLAKEFI